MNAEDIIELLKLEPHPEGGLYRETLRDAAGADGRSWSTAIYYLLRRGETSRWHRVDATEVWHWYAGAALELLIAEGVHVRRVVLGSRLEDGERPQGVVPAPLAKRPIARGVHAGWVHRSSGL